MFFRQMEDLPSPDKVPESLSQCHVKYTMFEEQYSIPVHLKVGCAPRRLANTR